MLRLWDRIRSRLYAHQTGLTETLHVAHLAYFLLVATHGPYYWLAGVCFIVGAAIMLAGGEL